MGGNVSKVSLENRFKNEDNTQMYQTVQSICTNATENANSMNVSNVDKLNIDGDLVLSNMADNQCLIDTLLSNDYVNKIDADLKQELEQEQKASGVFQFNAQISDQVQVFESKSDTDIRTEIFDECKNSNKNTNEINWQNIGEIDIGGSVLLDNVAYNECAKKVLSRNAAERNIDLKQTQSADISQETSFFDVLGFGGTMAIIGISCCVCIVIVIIIIIGVMGKKGKGGSPPPLTGSVPQTGSGKGKKGILEYIFGKNFNITKNGVIKGIRK